ncbi:MAG: 30S ribosomal protein S3 [Candidatus Harrisonbacteria bacterium RIFCSPLOWO2_02_FULL_41_11]|uniref:Small ribosomal subunit protein uS3 n=1 Tax=Candidatus Harrisonbacteria bacterium RIFCSPHIGHO2_02_FULL_42_16 TaxID=1798404 RepID=A0A1G1ZIP6_9BACT|nr:MAG: 30S ribosomal protein S3 [Candidatus Harrisonbacteria bacterium RIFCSPHIGHO2_02_FULL_42_16]OGY67645.1 MAG: 30S ribosomal protein S3 [Candidatus Harrisonbacteria bacterium RIFCSPLOWO2_02_FULL_41_11]
MGQKIRPNSFRLGISSDWASKWFLDKKAPRRLEEDVVIRKIINERISSAGIDKIGIERTVSNCRIFIKVAKPGLVIGRGGKGIEELTKAIESALLKLSKKYKKTEKSSLSLNVEELKRTDVSAKVTSQQIAWDLEKRLPYRRTMKKYLEGILRNREAQGAKIRLSGRLDGNEIARREWLGKGRLPLTTLRSNIDFGESTAYTTYGTVGIKVWIYKGEIQ